jgi:NAD(P)-dependent dehydrogenase (short-subunit alcohol dehydrogenase family)
MSRPVIVVVGAGPGVSGSVARRFADEGYDVALLGADQQVLDDLVPDLEARGATVGHTVADVTDEQAARDAVREKDPMQLTVAELLEDVALGVGALLTVAQAARPYMSSGGRISVTGSMAADQPWERAASLGVQKAGVRNLVHSLDKTLAPDGIRAVSVTVRGSLAREGAFTPDRVAEAIWAAVTTDESQWRSEVPYSG